jgi:hypothetical protein
MQHKIQPVLLLKALAMNAGSVLLVFLCISFTTNPNNESAIKAMFIYNFTKYIDWPPDQKENFTIAILGQSEVGNDMLHIASNKKVNNKHIIIKNIQQINGDENYEILFIPESEKDKLKNAAEILQGKGVLLITESKNMAQQGSCINIISLDGKFRFELNENAIRKQGLKVSHQLLTLAIIVK